MAKFTSRLPPSQHVHVVDAQTWTEEHAFRTPGLRNHGLAWEGDKLWVADTSAGTVNLLDTADGRVYQVIRVQAPDESPRDDHARRRPVVLRCP